MKLAAFILLISLVSTSCYSQLVTLSETNVSLRKVMVQIRKQTGYYFSLGDLASRMDSKFSIHVKNIPIKEALDEIFRNKPFTYEIKDKIIVVIERVKRKPAIQVLLAVSGKVENENGEPLPDATVTLLNSQKGAITNSNGQFILTGIQKNSMLQISSVGYELQQLVITGQTKVEVKLKPAIKGLDETVVIGYGKTSHRLNTGDVFKVKGSEILDQPAPNFVAALEGRVPGLIISQTSGIPGTAFNAQLHGRASIGTLLETEPANNPLFIIDDIPFAPNNNNLPTISTTASFQEGRNSFDLINTYDIESIEVLKDADATAIYGSRGANGVILITTKKGYTGKPTINININTGLGRITRYPDMMNTGQYVKMRREAIMNDGNIPNSSNAPDLFKWDTTRYTDFKKELIGGTSKISNINLSIVGGTKQTQYLFSSSLRCQTTVFPGNFADNTFYSHGYLNYKSKNDKLNTRLSLIATHDDNLSPATDMTVYVNQPPNAPAFYDSTGNLIWQQGGYSFNNPMATLLQPYHAITNNILVGFNSSYNIFKNLSVKLNTGFNNIKIDESFFQPRKSLNTFIIPNAKGNAYFAYSKLKSWIAEPQLEYISHISKGKFSILVGGTYQQLNSDITNYAAYGFPDDFSLTDLSKATSLTITPKNTVYKYVGVFGKLSYNWLDKYILNITGRRDGSSRFGPGKQFGNFGAIGAAWVFSNEPFIIKKIPFINFGKVRTSYGVTGNDQIGDYKYFDSWMQTQYTYQGDTGLIPNQPANPYFSWEENKKLEGALEIGLFNKLVLTAAYYLNKTDNQLIAITVPSITGFERIPAANSGAVVQNTGWELGLKMSNNLFKNFDWNANFVITIPKNKLIAFPGLLTSPYAYKLILGKPLSVISGYTYNGINSSTGIFEFKDFDKDGMISYPNDYSIIGNNAPKYYGSVINSFNLKGWQLDFLIEFKKQTSYNFLYNIYRNKPPGLSRSNQPALLNSYWHKQGDFSNIQKLTASTSSSEYAEIEPFTNSTGVISDASYLKIKTLLISYSLPARTLKILHLKKCRFYISSNNLLIFTNFKGTDPETVDTFTLPPLRTISAGTQINF